MTAEQDALDKTDTELIRVSPKSSAIYRFAWLLLISLLAREASAAAVAEPEKTPLSFGVFPYLPPAQLEQLYAPVAADLSRAIHRPVQLRTRPNFRSFANEVRRQSYDLIFIQPLAYAQLASKHGYQALARPGRPLRAIIVVPEKSSITSLADLHGKEISAPPQLAAVSILGLQMLLDKGLQPGNDISLIHGKSHVACLRMTLIGKTSACITAAPPLSMFSKKSGIPFRVIARGNPVPASTFAVHRRVARSTRDTLLKQILHWGKTPSGQKLIHSLGFSPFIPSLDRDYKALDLILDDTKAFREAPVQHAPPSKY